MTDPQPSEPKPAVNPGSGVKGEPLDLEDLLALAPIDEQDIASALVFIDDHAPDKVKEALQ